MARRNLRVRIEKILVGRANHNFYGIIWRNAPPKDSIKVKWSICGEP